MTAADTIDESDERNDKETVGDSDRSPSGALGGILLARTVALDGVEAVARDVAARLSGGLWLFLDGDLGAGKTTFAQRLLALLGADETARSPTFSIMNTLPMGPRAASGLSKVLHLDLYRLKSGRELCYLGLEESFGSRTLAVFEWPGVVDDEEWEDFFSVTGCRRPRKVLRLSIETVEGAAGAEDSRGARRYLLEDLADCPFLRPPAEG